MKKYVFFILFFSEVLIFYTETIFCQMTGTFFIWVNNVELQPFPDRVNIDNKKFLTLGDEVEVLEFTGDYYKIKKTDDKDGTIGWVPKDFCTNRKNEIKFFLQNEFVPEDIFVIGTTIKEKSNFLVSSYSPGLNYNSYSLQKGCVLYYKTKNPNSKIDITLFETTFSDIKPYFKYYFDGNSFIELAPSSQKGYTVVRKIYPDSKIFKMDLIDAMRLNKITALYYGLGKSSGDAICAKLMRNSETPLHLKLDQSFLLKSLDGQFQNMVIWKLKGKYLSEGSYIRQDYIDLASYSGGTFLFEAYCLDLEKENPSENTFYVFEKYDPNLQLFFKIVDELQVQKVETIQIALWKLLNETDDKIEKHFKLNPEKVNDVNIVIKKYLENGGKFPLH